MLIGDKIRVEDNGAKELSEKNFIGMLLSQMCTSLIIDKNNHTKLLRVQTVLSSRQLSPFQQLFASTVIWNLLFNFSLNIRKRSGESGPDVWNQLEK